MNGTHIPAYVSAVNGVAYQNQKGTLSQNVLGVYTMNIQFCYIFVGWKGLAHDDKVLKDILFEKDFIIPEKKFYLTDTGYHNTNYLLCPYRNV